MRTPSNVSSCKPLVNQLVHWKDSYHLLEALESNEGAYEKLKEAAKRIEQRNLTLQNIQGGSTFSAKEGKEARKPERARRLGPPTTPRPEREPGGSNQEKGPLCYNCHEHGHLARECGKVSKKPKHREGRGATSLSARLEEIGCCAVEIIKSQQPRKRDQRCPLFGDKMTTTINIFGRTRTGLLDTGSGISILPARVLLQAKRDEYDIDKEVVEHKIDMSKRLYDASGSVMTFVTIVEVMIQETQPGSPQVLNQMYVTSAEENLVTLGTNVLPHLGYKLVKGMMPGTQVADDVHVTTGIQEPEPEFRISRIGQRAYVAPGSVKGVKLTSCCREEADWLLESSSAMITAGVCRTDVDGSVEVPVVNWTMEATVFRPGEPVGNGSKQAAEWVEASTKDIPTISSRVFMELPTEKGQSKYPEPTSEWDGPFRVLDVSETSALISRIGANEEPLRIQMDMLRDRRQRQKRGRVRASRVTAVDVAPFKRE
ncbi:hypothetical protein Aduo_000666 [Ancylostoma duodenale]